MILSRIRISVNEKNLAFVIPSYNEAETINKTIDMLKKYGTPIIIDDCSTDETEKTINKKMCIYIRNLKNLGYDLSLSKGFYEAEKNKFKYVITVDADLQNNIDDIVKVIKALNNYDLVLTKRDRKQRISEVIFAFFSNLILSVQDPLSGVKGYSIDLYKKYKFIGFFKNSIGTWLATMTILNGINFTTIPITITPRADKPRFGSVISANYKIIFGAIFFLITCLKFFIDQLKNNKIKCL